MEELLTYMLVSKYRTDGKTVTIEYEDIKSCDGPCVMIVRIEGHNLNPMRIIGRQDFETIRPLMEERGFSFENVPF